MASFKRDKFLIEVGNRVTRLDFGAIRLTQRFAEKSFPEVSRRHEPLNFLKLASLFVQSLRPIGSRVPSR